MLDKLQVGPLGNVAKKLLEDQKLQNRKRELMRAFMAQMRACMAN